MEFGKQSFKLKIKDNGWQCDTVALERLRQENCLDLEVRVSVARSELKNKQKAGYSCFVFNDSFCVLNFSKNQYIYFIFVLNVVFFFFNSER